MVAPLPAGARGTETLVKQLRRLNEKASRYFPIALMVIVLLAFLDVIRTSSSATATAQLRDGLTVGAIYALVAVGYTMVYGIIELINFAHGDVFTLSAFYSILFERLLHWVGLDLDRLALSGAPGFVGAFLILIALSMPAAGITGMLIERVAYRRLRDAPRLAPLITAIGVSFLIEGFMFSSFGGANVNTGRSPWVHGTAFTIGGVSIDWINLFVIAAALGMMFALQAFITRSKLGKAMRATAQDRDAALLNGININRTIAATFFIGSALAAVGGIIYSIRQGVIDWQLGLNFGIIAFTSAVLGGIGNIVGAGAGGFLIGVIAALGGQLLGQEWANSIIFAMLVVVLTFRPTGLLGMRVPDRA